MGCLNCPSINLNNVEDLLYFTIQIVGAISCSLIGANPYRIFVIIPFRFGCCTKLFLYSSLVSVLEKMNCSWAADEFSPPESFHFPPFVEYFNCSALFNYTFLHPDHVYTEGKRFLLKKTSQSY